MLELNIILMLDYIIMHIMVLYKDNKSLGRKILSVNIFSVIYKICAYLCGFFFSKKRLRSYR
jgi:hypothetical protein